MRLQHHLIIFSSTMVVLAAGCSPVQPQSTIPGTSASQAARSAIRPSKSLPRDLLYVGGAIKTPGWVTIYPQKGNDQQKTGAITEDVDTPFAVAVDASENLYAGNYDNATVTVYQRGAKTPFETLTNAGKPIAIAVAADGTVYVANLGTGDTPPSGASIIVYQNGQTVPSQTIPIADGSFPWGLAVDSSGNLFANVDEYLSRTKSYNGAVYKFAPGSTKGKDLHLRDVAGELSGLATDEHNDLLVVDIQKTAFYVLVYAPGEKLPSHKIEIYSGQEPVGIAINRENSEIWVTSGFGGVVRGISYPSGRVLDVVARHRGWAWGVAVSPASDQ